MKEILATWIIVQLLVIGFVGGVVSKEISKKTYKCTQNERSMEYVLASTLLPLSYFAQTIPEIDEYCKNK